MYWFPKSLLGKISFWIFVTAFALMYLQYWAAMLFKTSVFLPGLLVMVGILGAGIASVIALVKKDRAILLWITGVVGCLFPLAFLVGELFLPH